MPSAAGLLALLGELKVGSPVAKLGSSAGVPCGFERMLIKSFFDGQEFLYRLVKELSGGRPVS